jgi:HD-GYP domain-containing protein (c-di-GMP phosphodiesterase class II)
VTVIATTELLSPGSEYLAALCQASSADITLTRQMLTTLSPVAACDVPRLGRLVRCAHEDQVQLVGGVGAVESIGRQLAESYEEMHLLYTIIQNMTVQQRPERFVADACEALLSTLSYSWVGALLADGSSHVRLGDLSGRLIIAGQHPEGRSAADLRRVVKQLIPQVQTAGAPLVWDPARNNGSSALQALGRTIIVHPILPPGSANADSGTILGVLIAGDKHGSDVTVSNVDIKLLGATATNMAIFLENAGLYDDLNAMFMGTLEALTASIDAKDRYTCGHSQRVAHLTQQLARAVGLDEHTVGRCRIAGLVHDVGKIGVPEGVLLKPGRLTVEEFALIQKHPEIGHRILKDIPQLSDVLPGVLYHHERWDGRGYPHGLAGEAIPLVARLIGLVDAFDAMSTSRVYRSSLTRPEVLAEIVKCSGSQFDPELSRVFVRLDFSEFDQLVREHRALELGESSFVREEAA